MKYNTVMVKLKRKRMHDDVMKWNHFPRHWPFVLEIHLWLLDSPHKVPVTGKMFPSDDVIMDYSSVSDTICICRIWLNQCRVLNKHQICARINDGLTLSPCMQMAYQF